MTIKQGLRRMLFGYVCSWCNVENVKNWNSVILNVEWKAEKDFVRFWVLTWMKNFTKQVLLDLSGDFSSMLRSWAVDDLYFFGCWRHFSRSLQSWGSQWILFGYWRVPGIFSEFLGGIGRDIRDMATIILVGVVSNWCFVGQLVWLDLSSNWMFCWVVGFDWVFFLELGLSINWLFNYLIGLLIYLVRLAVGCYLIGLKLAQFSWAVGYNY